MKMASELVSHKGMNLMLFKSVSCFLATKKSLSLHSFRGQWGLKYLRSFKWQQFSQDIFNSGREY